MKVRCMIRGHDCERTGRHSLILREWRCKDCGGLYVSNADHYDLNALIPADAESDRIFRSWMEQGSARAPRAATGAPPVALREEDPAT